MPRGRVMDVGSQLESRFFQDDLRYESTTKAVTTSIASQALTAGTRYMVWASCPGDAIYLLMYSAAHGSYAPGDIAATHSMMLLDGDRIAVSPATGMNYLLVQSRAGNCTIQFRAMEAA